ncbi:uncharacterized protein AB675_8375 [Cyphellophora attinorum]|uniref:Pheromone-regulated membrane protein 10 n=1 Tax=Cyphellophora attinorum TaxID=1664694 RepID=A0A0N1HGB7_9EURO|nr:uncharacterized protein AB675_8375 [Phialophora attinorum]KPI44624.1 hypothetical protein AB675_8375 [Phialophora attinorum]
MASDGRQGSSASTPDNDNGGARSARLKSALRPQRVNFSLGGESPPEDAPASTTAAAAAEKARHNANQLYSDLSRSGSLEDLSNPSTRESAMHDTAPLRTDGMDESSLSKLLPWTSRKYSRRSKKSVAEPDSPPLRPLNDYPIRLNDLPLSSFDKPERPYDLDEDTDDSDGEDLKPLERQQNAEYMEEATRLVRTMTRARPKNSNRDPRSGTRTPALDKHVHDVDYLPPPQQYKPSVLGALLTSRLNELQQHGHRRGDFYNDYVGDTASPSGSRTPERSSAGSSGRVTPSRKPKWYDKPEPGNATAALLAQAGVSSIAPSLPGASTPNSSRRPGLPRSRSSGMISSAVNIIKNGASSLRPPAREASDHIVTINAVADILARRRYLTKLCRAFMEYGAPTHRLEEYMNYSARALCMNAQFLYMPGAMICTFIDETTYSTDLEMIRTNQGLDFGRLKDAFDVYKMVIHDKTQPAEASRQLDEIANSTRQHSTWFRIFIFGLAAVCVSPFAFSGRPVDFGPIFLMGAVTGFLQLQIVPRSSQFSHVFEVFAAVLTAFVARGLGSIRHNNQSVFCFSALAQSSIALILPGYIVLNAALELQSKNLLSGSVRMVYAIIYTLFLGFGLLIGTVIYGLVDKNATTDVTCNVPVYWNPTHLNAKLLYTRFIWVPLFACCLAIINQAKWKQLPMMAFVATAGYQANFWVSTRLASNIQVANAIGAFVIGAIANLYSRMFHGLAAAAMLPAIFVMVPSGLAASGTLVAGINSSEQITNNATGISIINNGTQGFLQAQDDPNSVYGGTIFNVGYGMVQVAIGISVGLYLSALIVYPYGKRKSGLFSF